MVYEDYNEGWLMSSFEPTHDSRPLPFALSQNQEGPRQSTEPQQVSLPSTSADSESKLPDEPPPSTLESILRELTVCEDYDEWWLMS